MRWRASPGGRGAVRAAALRAGALAPLPKRKEADALPDSLQDAVFALDIGTRSIVGVLGREEDGRLRVLDIEKEDHGRRAMLDGQIEDIEQVASVARQVISRLEERQHLRLKKVCVAAAGRALKSARASFTLEFSEARLADDEIINQLEAGAVSAAESVVSEGGEGAFYMVGYTASQYRLDGYPMSTLYGHHGQVLEADVVATFLPREVVDSLYAVVSRLGLEVSSLTLEPIASLNAAIPVDIRLLNLVLVDIGAGTSDIAICRDGSVTGYTMATVAGDEITELLMKKLLIDFKTGEELKMGIGGSEPLKYHDILGLPHECTSEELIEMIEPAVQRLAEEIAARVLELNGAAPSAVFLAGGGSKLHGLRQAVSKALGMDDARVAIAGNHFEKNAFSDTFELNDPEYSTPLGIAISAALGMINDSYVVTLNGLPAKLFRSGTLNVRDILLMNGCNYGDMMGRTGANLAYTLNGERQFVRGTPGTPPVIELNGAAAELSAVVHAGDSLRFVPAKAGENASRTLGEALGKRFSGGVTVNDAPQALSYWLHTGDMIITGTDLPAPLPDPVQAEPKKEEAKEPLMRARATVRTGDTTVEVPVKPQRTHLKTRAAESGEDISLPLEGQLQFESTPVRTPRAQRSAGVKVPRTAKASGSAKLVSDASAVRVSQEPPSKPAPKAKPEPVKTEPEDAVKTAEPVKSEPEEAAKAAEPAEPEIKGSEPIPPASEATEKAVEPMTGEDRESTPAPQPETVPEEPIRATVEFSAQPDRPKRHGIPRVVLPDLPGFAKPQKGLSIRLNGKPFTLPPKENGEPYYFMDVLQYSGLDFGHLDRPVELLRNGAACEFTQVLAENDDVIVQYQKNGS